MIYIMKKVIRTKKEIIFTMEKNDAKTFIFNLSKQKLKFASFAIIDSGKDNEDFLEVVNYFNPSFLIKSDFGILDGYLVNKNVGKVYRLAHFGARLHSITKIQNKIELAVKPFDANVTITLKEHTFVVVVTLKKTHVTFSCDYNLNIIETNIKDTEEISIETVKKLYTTINKILVKQRHYYNKKEEAKKNDKSSNT